MHKERATTGASFPVTALAYQLPEEAHLALVRTREHLLLLAGMTDSQTLAVEEPLQISPTALAQFFTRLAGDLDGVTAEEALVTVARVSEAHPGLA